VKIEFVKPEIVIRLVNFHLISLAVFINRKCDETAREIIENRWSPFDLERIVIPMFQIGDEIGRLDETQNQLAVFFRHGRVAVKTINIFPV